MAPFDPSIPQEAVIIARGRAASIRCARAAGAKPPKTAAWIAPRRVIARQAIRAAGIIGTVPISFCVRIVGSIWDRPTVDEDYIAAFHAFFSENAGEDFDFIEELGVSVSFGGAGHGGFPDNCDIVAVACVDVAIDTVVGCGDLAIREPGPLVSGLTQSS
jgi:hypothetical protein